MSGTDDDTNGIGPSANELSEEEEEAQLARSARSMRFGQYRFVGLIVVICALLMALSPLFNRYLEAYQAVVVAPYQDGRVRLLTPDGMPREKRVSSAAGESWQAGTYLQKDHLTWNPHPIDMDGLDYDPSALDPAREPQRALPEYYVRYMDEWQATITEVTYRLLPTQGGRPGEQEVEYRILLDLDDGSTRQMVVPESLRPAHLPSLGARRGAEELEKMLQGRRLTKRPLTWEPVVLEPEMGSDQPLHGADGHDAR